MGGAEVVDEATSALYRVRDRCGMVRQCDVMHLLYSDASYSIVASVIASWQAVAPGVLTLQLQRPLLHEHSTWSTRPNSPPPHA
jgi:hypothetical protein